MSLGFKRGRIGDGGADPNVPLYGTGSLLRGAPVENLTKP
jgi:hypothetical protein